MLRSANEGVAREAWAQTQPPLPPELVSGKEPRSLQGARGLQQAAGSRRPAASRLAAASDGASARQLTGKLEIGATTYN
eukprot:scaffold56570_cov34-Tisochrysis_lutea.AAC.2